MAIDAAEQGQMEATTTDEHTVKLAVQLLDGLRWSGIPMTPAIDAVGTLVIVVQRANKACGGTGAPVELVALLSVASRMIMGGTIQDRGGCPPVACDELLAVLERIAAVPTMQA